MFAYQLGAVWGRLLSLEMLLRLAISGGNFKLPFNASVGDEAEIDAINRWGYMSELVGQYNAIATAVHPECVLAAGNDIVLLRNALAHGIAISASPAPPLRLLKFGKPSTATGRVTVDFVADMTTEWLERQQHLVQNAIESVVLYVEAKGIGQSNA